MYKTPYNVANNQSEIYEFMIQNTFVSLIGFDGNFPVATQIPVETIILGDSIKIIGHMMTKTDHCRAFEKNQNVLVLYTSAHAYISASVYENPRSASTWNYKSVQAKGRFSSPTYIFLSAVSLRSPNTAKRKIVSQNEPMA